MKLYHCVFRNSKPPHYHAFISADDVEDLFCKIDEYGSPYHCEIYPCDHVSFCIKLVADVGEECLVMDKEETEFSELMFNDIYDEPNTKPKFITKKDGKLKFGNRSAWENTA